MIAYLDNSATTKPTEPVLSAMCTCMREGYFNPSAAYALDAERGLRACREAVAARVRAQADQVIFTSGGTESDNLGVLGFVKRLRAPGRALCLSIEHPAVSGCFEELSGMGWQTAQIPVREDGVMDARAFEALLTEDTRLVCVMQVSNETGAIQPIGEIAVLLKRGAPGAHLHVDGVQGFLRVPFLLPGLDSVSYALSAHKIGGPKGVGALITNGKPAPRALGGGQERGLRSGTENTPGIEGLRAAIQTYPDPEAMRTVKMRLYETLKRLIPCAQVNGPDPADTALSAPHILNMSFPPVRSQPLQTALCERGVYVGTGSACASRAARVSPVLKAMGLTSERLQSALRFSLCPQTTPDEVDYAARSLAECYATLARYVRR